MNKYRVEVVEKLLLHMEVEVEAESEEDARIMFEQNNMNGVYEDEWTDATDYAEVISSEIRVGVQE